MHQEIGELRKNLAVNINFYLAVRGMTQKQLSEASGVSVTSISRICTGQENRRIDNLEKMAVALGTTPEILIQEDGYKKAMLKEAGLSERELSEDRHYNEKNHVMLSMDRKKKVIFDKIISCDNFEEAADLYLIIKNAVRNANN